MLSLERIPLISGATIFILNLLLCQMVVGHPVDNNDINLVDLHPPIVNTIYGPVKGMYLPEGMQAYLGMPYAKPPVNKLRWSPPVEPTPWASDVFKALKISPGCPQNCFPTNPEVFCPRQVNEDCLYLNIWTPHDANPSSNLPVILFIHGGSFKEWSASAPIYDGRFVAGTSDVIFVTFNYRLGALGWLKTDGQEGLTGNYGLMDQRAAMKFVRENIRNFGGNPDKVTLNGQSAGAQSITLHMTNPATDQFFHQVILQSNPIAIPFANVSEAVLLSTKFSTYLNCTTNDISCLRSQRVDDIVWAQEQSSTVPINVRNPLLWFEQWGPIVDGVEIVQQPLIEIAQGNVQGKPMIIGVVSSEVASYMYGLFPTPPPQIVTLTILASYFGRFTLPVYKQYWEYWNPDIRPFLLELFSDYLTMCSSRNMTRSIKLFSDSPVYHYVFNHTFTDTSVWRQSPSNDICKTPGNTCHDTDLFFTFNSLTLSGYSYSPTERRLAEKVMTYWANFVHSGDPNHFDWRSNDIRYQSSNKNYSTVNRTVWNQHSNETEWPSLYFQTPWNTNVHDFRQSKCDLLDTIGYDGPVGPLSPDKDCCQRETP